MQSLTEEAPGKVPTAPPKWSAQLKRVLIVEDESLLALVLAEQITELGYTAVGPACNLPEARHLAETVSIDGAVLDLNMNGKISHEIADILSRREIPFVFITEYTKPPLGIYESIEILQKPFLPNDLRKAVKDMLVKPLRGRVTAAQRS